MAHHQSKFVSVNLNKSYGQPPAPSHGRPRHTSHSGSGGMVVLSRPRSSGSAGPKSAPKLSVPPPLNLPSLRKEHERFDSGAGAGTGAGPGSGPGTSTMGWTKPGLPLADAGQRAAGVRPPGQPPPASPARAVEKAVVLKGEDFPSLLASFTSPQKQKDAFNQKQKEEQALGEKPEPDLPLRMRPQMRSSRPASSSAADGNSLGAQKQSMKQDGSLPGPLPIIRLSHTSEWADDERDTGLSFPERERDRGMLRHDSSDGRGLRDAEAGSVLARDFPRGDLFGRDLNGVSKEARDSGSWRTPQQHTAVVARDGTGARTYGGSGQVNKDATFGHVDSAREAFGNGPQDPRYARRDISSGITSQNGYEQNVRGGRYGDVSGNRLGSMAAKGPFSSGSKGFSLHDPILNFGREKRAISNGGKSFLDGPGFDSSDPFSGDPIADVNVKLFKKKKDVSKQVDFHDPVRESFEAELERVQRMQEQQRQRVLEEQARALELARKEEEERERLVREEEERRRRLEEEAREAAWREEQGRLEAMRRAEEIKIAREEEKRRIFMEEERRKEAARQKLMELEARMARRQAEADNKDDKLYPVVDGERVVGPMNEKEVPRVTDIRDWEDNERMVEHIMPSASSDSLVMNRSFDAASRYQPLRDGSSAFVDRGKPANYWKREASDSSNSTTISQDQQNEYRGPRRDAFVAGRGFPRKDHYGSPGAMSGGRSFGKGGITEPFQMPDDLRYSRGDRWNMVGDGDRFNRSTDVEAEFLDSYRFRDGGWGPSPSRGRPQSPYGDRPVQSPEIDGFSSFSRSRHSMRQPRVLPPPSISSVHRNSFRAPAERLSSSPYIDGDSRYQHAGDNEQEIMQTAYHSRYQEEIQGTGNMGLPEDHSLSSPQKEKNSPRCDSQSSLSVSSPPSSPTQPSHDDMDESADSATRPSTAVEEQTILTDNEHIVSSVEVEDMNIVLNSTRISHEEDAWAIEKNEHMQQEEDYDDGDDYPEEDEAHERDDDNLVLSHKFDDLQEDAQNTADETDQLVLGFDEGVEVQIPTGDDVQGICLDNGDALRIENCSVGGMTVLKSSGLESLQAENGFPDGVMNCSGDIINETEKALQELVLDPEAPSSQPPRDVETFSNPGIPAPQQFASSTSLSLPSTSFVYPNLPSASIVTNQSEAPLKLQFGLFSGPSLIPSPVPSIQIGSIQMPLQLHPQVGPSIAQIHPSQPSFFQFGQLRYTPPISQGVLPLPPQTLSYVQPPPSAHYSMNQNLGGTMQNQVTRDSSSHRENPSSLPLDQQPGPANKPSNLPPENLEHVQPNTLANSSPKEGWVSEGQADTPYFPEDRNRMFSVSQPERHGLRNGTFRKNYRPVGNKKESQAQVHVEPNTSHFNSGEKAISRSKYPGVRSGSRGKKHAYNGRISGSRISFSGPDSSQANAGVFPRRARRNFRRTEFRVRGHVDVRQTNGIESYNYAGQDEELTSNTRVSGAKHAKQRDNVMNAFSSMIIEKENSTSGASGTRFTSYSNKMIKASGKEVESKGPKSIPAGEETVKRTGILEEDMDAPLQSGVVRIFKQPGIETPSDEDDFIEVRSKRQMLNDRREQREKEIKAKTRAMKAPRKHHAITQSIPLTSSSNKVATSSVGDVAINGCSDPIIASRRGFPSIEPSPVFTANMACQTLPPIGTPAVNGDSVTRSNNLKSAQIAAASAISSGAAMLVQSISIENKNMAVDNASTAFGAWENGDISQQVIALTQTQLDEAMKPALPDSNISSSVVLEPSKVTMSNMPQDKAFPSSTSPLSSLLAGEKIQFGAVTSPSILLPVSRPISTSIGPPGSKRSDIPSDHCAPVPHNNCTMFFDKEKHPEESGAHLEDPEAEAEAEAAASAVAVAAISSNDEISGSRSGANSVSVSDGRSFSTTDAGGLTSGAYGTSCQEAKNHSAGEESFTVSLPADLSVDTPSLSLWPPLASPQSSGPMLSHFSGAPPSHFPCFEMNPLLGAPIFTFGSPDESVGTQAQPQRSTMLGSGPPGAWQQCPSGVDSYYVPSAGFGGPFIGPGGIHGVQGPPHMVVYNHFTPVGQFGQVGLSFMGTTYIPAGKQPDWKHNPVSSATSVGEGDVNNLNVASGQRNPPSIAAPIQHIAPGSSLMPMASPLAMFEMPHFQPSAEIPMQARWPQITAPSPLHAVPLTVPPLLQHQVDSGILPQFSQALPGDAITGSNRFSECHSSTSADGNRNLPGSGDPPSFPSELLLAEASSTPTSKAQAMKPSYITASANSSNKGLTSTAKSSTRNPITNGSEPGAIGINVSSTDGQSVVSSLKVQSAQQLTSSGSHYLHSVASADQRGGGPSQKTGSGGEWHRRVGFHGRNQSLGSDKSFSSAKVKQIYVAKQPASGSANQG